LKLLALHNRREIESFLNNQSIDNYFYHCSHLESGFWEYTQWFGLCDGGEILALAMLIMKYEQPVLLASSYQEGDSHQLLLLQRLRPYLPRNIYCHLDRHAAEKVFGQHADMRVTPFLNMKWTGQQDSLSHYDPGSIHQLGMADMKEIVSFLETSHPGHLIDEDFIQRGGFVALKENNTIISMAGVVAQSDQYRVVSIGNVATHPDHRRKNLASQTISALIHLLSPTYQTITLNVKAANHAAIRCYQKLGFEETGVFDEVIFS
jgi:ribosomal protein S18 acetylase RimI-like enzyme